MRRVCRGCGRRYSPIESAILRALEAGPLTVSEIAAHAGKKHVQIANVAARLHRRGVLLREPQSLPLGGREYRWRNNPDAAGDRP